MGLLLLVGGLLLVPSVRWPVFGWLRGEAFYQRMPTSWWASEIEGRYEPLEVQIDTKRRLWGTCWVVQAPNSPWDRSSKLCYASGCQSGPIAPAAMCGIGTLNWAAATHEQHQAAIARWHRDCAESNASPCQPVE